MLQNDDAPMNVWTILYVTFNGADKCSVNSVA